MSENLGVAARGLFLSWVMLASSVSAANWYVDPAAIGAKNGTNWANAWRSPTNIVWKSINPGDTIYLSGGSTSQVYREALYMPSGKSGTAGAWITIAVGQEAGHNGLVIFDGVGLAPHYTSQYVWLNGARNPSFVNPTNHDQVLGGGTAITNNIGIRIQNIIGTANSDTDPVLWYFTGTETHDQRFSYIEVTGISNSFAALNPGYDWKGSVCYVNFPSGYASNIVWEYCYLRDNACQQFGGGNNATNFDAFTFKFGIISGQGEDTFEEGGGWSIHDSIIGPANCWITGKVHEDHFQFTGNYIKIYNNIIWPAQNSTLRLQTSPNAVRHDFYYFNNEVVELPGRSPNGGTLTEPLCFVHFSPSNPGQWAMYSNIVIANNLFYGSVPNTAQGFPEISRNAVVSWSKGAVTNCYITNCLFANNLVVEKEKGLSLPSTASYEPYTPKDFVFDYNVIAASNPALDSPRRVNYIDISTNAEFLGVYQFQNRTNYPLFVDPTNVNFELRPADTAALNKGTNLSSIFAFDALNRARNIGGAWDRGPLEYQGTASPEGNALTNGLLTWLTFNDGFSDGRLDDASGNGADGYRFGRSGSVYPTNFPAQILSSTTPGRTNLAAADYCGRFDWYSTGYGLYGREGDYAGITNVSRLTNMATASIMCWARYYPPHAGLDYSSDANAELLSAGTSTGVLGTWELGRYNQNIKQNNTRFIVLTNSSAFTKSILEFPESAWQDNTTNWHHYAVTWNNGVMVGYMDGVAFQTNDISSIVTRLQVGANNNNPTPWIGIGCNTHGGTPWLGDESPQIEYPNNGFMNGVIDEVRIYGVALSANDVLQIYLSGANGGLVARPQAPTGLRVLQAGG